MNETVLDPFLGITTAVVAKRFKRRWIGIEKERNYITEAKTESTQLKLKALKILKL